MSKKVESVLTPLHYELVNDSHSHRHHHAMADGQHGDETHFNLLIVSPVFENMSRIDRQRRVQELFAEERDQGLHALSMKLLSPREWEQRAESAN